MYISSNWILAKAFRTVLSMVRGIGRGWTEPKGVPFKPQSGELQPLPATGRMRLWLQSACQPCLSLARRDPSTYLPVSSGSGFLNLLQGPNFGVLAEAASAVLDSTKLFKAFKSSSQPLLPTTAPSLSLVPKTSLQSASRPELPCISLKSL